MPLFDALLGHALQFVEGLFTIAGLMTSGLWHPSHPFQFRTIEVIGTGYFCPFVVDTLLTFLQIIGVVATIGIDGTVVEFENHGAYTVEEETVVGHHQ